MVATRKDAEGECGTELTEQYLDTLRATASFLNVFRSYFAMPRKSAEEAIMRPMLNDLLDNLREHPEKTVELVQSLAALVIHLEKGGTMAEWFKILDEPA
jgi:hypothetical protein